MLETATNIVVPDQWVTIRFFWMRLFFINFLVVQGRWVASAAPRGFQSDGPGRESGAVCVD